MSSGCLFLFGLVFLLAGLGVGAVIVHEVYHGYRAHTVYVPASCVIQSKRLVESSDSDGTTYRPEFTFTFQVAPGAVEAGGDGVAYTVTDYDGTNTSSSGRRGHQAILDAYQVGQSYPCWYDPSDPNRAVLVKPSAWNLLWLLFPIPFVGFGLFGVVVPIRHWLGRGSEAQLFEGTSSPAPASPKPAPGGEPEPEWERGAKLAYRLKCETAEKAVAIGLGCFGLVWTGISGGVWVSCLRGGDWIGIIFLGLFVLAGLGMLGAAFWQGLIGWGWGPRWWRPAPPAWFRGSVSRSGSASPGARCGSTGSPCIWFARKRPATGRAPARARRPRRCSTRCRRNGRSSRSAWASRRS
ncbi:MAG: DUF3592 domain-containing protein [Planctomycetota bacterium]|nr:DUF3592 domain-containing protein [Planctomycetota bacterium]